MSFLDTTWPCGGDVSFKAASTDPISEDFEITWDIASFLRSESKILDEKRLKSEELRFADTSWQLFVSFDGKRGYSQFGMNVRSIHSSSDTECSCRLSFISFSYMYVAGTVTLKYPISLITLKEIFLKFKYGSTGSLQVVKDFLKVNELLLFLEMGLKISCTVSINRLSVKEACSQTDTTYPSKSSAVESSTQTHLPENEEKEMPKLNLDRKLCFDLKNLLLSGEDFDVTIQVRNQQFKAHRLILAARSQVFASMFRHDTKEKQTGVVDVEDCEPSAFPVLLEYIYCGSTENVSVENVFGLYTAADKYDVQELKTECLEFIKNSLSVETFCETVRLSLEHSETNLLKLTINFFARNMKEIVKTAKWQSFIIDNPIQGNEILIKALASCNIVFPISEKEAP